MKLLPNGECLSLSLSGTLPGPPDPQYLACRQEFSYNIPLTLFEKSKGKSKGLRCLKETVLLLSNFFSHDFELV